MRFIHRILPAAAISLLVLLAGTVESGAGEGLKVGIPVLWQMSEAEVEDSSDVIEDGGLTTGLRLYPSRGLLISLSYSIMSDEITYTGRTSYGSFIRTDRETEVRQLSLMVGGIFWERHVVRPFLMAGISPIVLKTRRKLYTSTSEGHDTLWSLTVGGGLEIGSRNHSALLEALFVRNSTVSLAVSGETDINTTQLRFGYILKLPYER